MLKPYPLYLDLLELAIASASEPQRNLHFPLFRHAGTRLRRSPPQRRGRPRGTHEEPVHGDRPGSDVSGVGREISRQSRSRRVLVAREDLRRAQDSQRCFEFGEVIADVVVVAGRRGAEAAYERKVLPAAPTQIVPGLFNYNRESEDATRFVMSAGITAAGAICVVAGEHVNRLGGEQTGIPEFAEHRQKPMRAGRDGPMSQRHLISGPDLFLVRS